MSLRKPKPPSKAVPNVMFRFACFTFVIGLYLHCSVLLVGYPVVPAWAESENSKYLWMGVGLAHFASLYVTAEPFRIYPSLPRYPPLFHSDRDRIRWARSFLVVIVANFVCWAVTLPRPVDEEAGWTIITSFYLICPAYLAVHWAFQPENVFPQWFLNFFYGATPLTLPPRLYAKRHAIPLHEWLTGLIDCCQRVVASKRLVDAEYPGPGEIDCLELQCEVLYDLESRACLVHHKKLLSQDGFREIRRFLQAVHKLDHKLPNELSWPAVVESARTILDMQGRLTAD